MKNKWHIETRLIADLIPHPKNPRQFTEKGMKDLGRSIDAFGLAEPIVVNTDDTICGGHARVMVLKQRGETECECYVPERQLSEKEVEQLMIRLNANQAGVWDTERLANEWDLSELMDWGLDISGFGQPEATEDDYEMPDEIITSIKRGDIFKIGDHHLMCGDATSEEDVKKLLDGNCPILCVSDPPYGVNYDADWRNGTVDKQGKIKGKVGQGGRAIGKVTNDDNARWLAAYQLFKGDVIYIWCASLRSALVHQDIIDAGFIPDYLIIWNKDGFVIGRGDYHWKHEPCWYAHRKGKNHNWQKSRNETTVWDIPRPKKSETGHSTQKPIECMARPIRNNSAEGESVYDPFVGSGTTLVAGQQLGRKVFAMEISPQYVQVCIDRMKKAFPDIEIQQIN